MNTEILIERYRRNNEHEHTVMSATIRALNPTIFDKHNSETIVQQRIKRTKGPTLFLDASNGNLTATGQHYRKTEMRVKNIFVEVKHQKTISNIQESVMAEITRAENINGKYWLVLLGDAYMNTTVLNEFWRLINKYKLQNKVRIFLDVDSYVKALLEENL